MYLFGIGELVGCFILIFCWNYKWEFERMEFYFLREFRNFFEFNIVVFKKINIKELCLEIVVFREEYSYFSL